MAHGPIVTVTYARYAIYAAPAADSPLGRFGNAWLGRDPAAAGSLPRPPVAGYNQADIAAMTVSPSRYGFHGTLKPPFRLADGTSEAMLRAALDAFAATVPPVALSGFDIRSIGKFVAIVPAPASAALNALAEACVSTLDRFRAPPSAAETEKRKQASLSPSQEANLARWGYPYVMDDFRFHMTLTDPLPAPRRDQVAADLAAYASQALGPHLIDDLALFAEPERGAPFELIARSSLRR